MEIHKLVVFKSGVNVIKKKVEGKISLFDILRSRRRESEYLLS